MREFAPADTPAEGWSDWPMSIFFEKFLTLWSNDTKMTFYHEVGVNLPLWEQ